jgi:DNA-binding Xre family transcriptional regulator
MSKDIKSFSKNKIYKVLMNKVIQSDKSPIDMYAALKKATNASNKQITYWMENLGNQPSLGQISVIAQVLECSIEDLIEYETAKPKASNSKKASKIH